MTLTFFGLIYFLFVNEITSTTDDLVSRDSTCVKPIQYIIDITPNVQNNSLYVDSRVELNISCVQQDIRIYLGRYCNDEYVLFIDTDIVYDKNTYWSYSTLFTKDRFMDISLRNLYQNNSTTEVQKINLHRGIYRIHRKYNCNLKKVAMIFSYVDQTKKETYLILPRIPAEWIFPYWENPATKAKFTIRIIHEYSTTALSHMPGDRIVDKNKFYTLFSITPVMVTQLVAIVVVPYEYAIPIVLFDNVILATRFEVRKDILYASILIEDITIFLREKVKDVISASHVRYVALPINSSSYNTIVTTGLVLFRDADIAYNKEVDSIIRKTEVTCLVVRSVIQEMFSNWLVAFKQSDPWFVEGFSTFYGVYLSDQIYNETLLMSIVVQARRVDFEYTEAFSEYDLSMQNYTFLHNVTFNKMWKEKAFIIFYMMNTLFRNQDVLYNTIFEKAITTYNTTSSETYNDQSVLENIWNNLMFVPSINENIHLKYINIQNVITSWITHDGYPVIQVKREHNTQFLEIKIQDCVAFKQKNLCAYKWWIPVIYVKISKKASSTNYVYLKPDGKSIFIANIEADDFIIITTHNGYRVNYDHKTLENIALFLESEQPEIWNVNELSDVTLAHILDDAFYFLIQNTKYNVHPAAKNNNIEIFFNLASNIIVYMKNSYITWYPVLTALQYISKIFPYPETAFMKTKILKLLNIFLEDTSHKNFSENSISNQIYYEVVKWTCILDGVKCKEHVNAILKWHLENSVKNKLLPSWQKWIYCQSLILENGTFDTSDLWQNIEKIYSTHRKQEKLFELLPCFGHNSLQTSRKIEVEDTKMSLNVLFDSVVKYSKDVKFFKSIISRINNVARDNLLAVVTFIINNTYSEENLKKISVGLLYNNLIDIYNIEKARFMLDIIMKKAENRRTFLNKISSAMRHKPHELFKSYV